MKANEAQSSCCCDNVFCRKNDRAIFEKINMPILVEFCGNLIFANIIDIRFLYMRIFFCIYSGFIIIWNFVRFAEQGYAKWWAIYFTQWFSLFTTFYFFFISIVHYHMSNVILKYEIISKSSSNDSTNAVTNQLSQNNESKCGGPNTDLSLEPPSYGLVIFQFSYSICPFVLFLFFFLSFFVFLFLLVCILCVICCSCLHYFCPFFCICEHVHAFWCFLCFWDYVACAYFCSFFFVLHCFDFYFIFFFFCFCFFCCMINNGILLGQVS